MQRLISLPKVEASSTLNLLAAVAVTGSVTGWNSLLSAEVHQVLWDAPPGPLDSRLNSGDRLNGSHLLLQQSFQVNRCHNQNPPSESAHREAAAGDGFGVLLDDFRLLRFQGGSVEPLSGDGLPAYGMALNLALLMVAQHLFQMVRCGLFPCLCAVLFGSGAMYSSMNPRASCGSVRTANIRTDIVLNHNPELLFQRNQL